MGNYISCTFVFVPPLMTKNNTKTTKVIFPSGEVKQYRDLVNAAELMLECPNHFLANSRSLHIGHRFSPLAADEELELGNVYVFFPIRRANCVVIAADVAVLFVGTNLVAKRLSGGVLPENSSGESQPKAEEESIPRLSLDGIDLGFQYRLTYCRSRKPLLETINEELICSR